MGRRERRKASLALLLLVPAPSIGVVVALWLAPGELGQAVYAFCKLWIVAFPLIWWLRVDRQRLSLSPLRRGGLGVGALSGLGIALAIVGCYRLLGDRLIDPEMMRAAAARNGLDRKAVYLALTAQLALVNSLLEEYVWRWFVYRKCESLMPARIAAVATALFFSIHHALALLPQFGVPVAMLGTAGTFVGSLIWSWCYRRYQSIWPAYVSHFFVDVGVFAVGWFVLFGD